MTDQKKPVDWADIERDYRESPMSIREIAAWYGVSDTAIRKRAKKDGWLRPEAVAGSRCEPANLTRTVEVVQTPLTPENVAPEAIVGRGRNLVLRLLDELDATTTRLGELEAIIASATELADAGKQREALLQAVSLKQRSEVLKSLATAAKTLAEAGVAAPSGGKKAERQAKGEAVAAGGGRFAAPAPPLRVVK